MPCIRIGDSIFCTGNRKKGNHKMSKAKTTFKCPHCEKSVNYYRIINTMTKEHFAPFHHPAFVTQLRTATGNAYLCSVCNKDVTSTIENCKQIEKGDKPNGNHTNTNSGGVDQPHNLLNGEPSDCKPASPVDP